MPREYRLIRAAKILNCTPWELEDQDITWLDWAFIAENADALVAKALKDRANKGYDDFDDD